MIATEIIKKTGIQEELILSQSRKVAIVAARQVVMYLLREKYKMRYIEIGYRMNRHASSVYYSVKKAKILKEINDPIIQEVLKKQ